ncbi:hypothetical protein FKM82_018976 [Ascaphus truei]
MFFEGLPEHDYVIQINDALARVHVPDCLLHQPLEYRRSTTNTLRHPVNAQADGPVFLSDYHYWRSVGTSGLSHYAGRFHLVDDIPYVIHIPWGNSSGPFSEWSGIGHSDRVLGITTTTHIQLTSREHFSVLFQLCAQPLLPLCRDS